MDIKTINYIITGFVIAMFVFGIVIFLLGIYTFTLKRIFKEFFNPYLKCERLGHKHKVHKAIICTEGMHPIVLRTYTAEIEICTRCKEHGRTFHKVPLLSKHFNGAYASGTLSGSQWIELDKRGYIIIEKLQ